MGERREYCTFYLGTNLFGVEVKRVQEVLKYQTMTRVPLAPDIVQGLINLRGQIVVAIDLRRRLKMPPRAKERLPMNVVLRTGEGAASLLVDEIGDVVELDSDAFEPPPQTLQGSIREVIQGAYKMKSQLLLVLDAAHAIRSPAE